MVAELSKLLDCIIGASQKHRLNVAQNIAAAGGRCTCTSFRTNRYRCVNHISSVDYDLYSTIELYLSIPATLFPELFLK